MPSTRHLLDFYLEYLEDSTNNPEDDLSDSFMPPCSYWTAWEKEVFFEALKRHSRLKPELIQEEIGATKSVWEVCSYINLLDSASTATEIPSSSYVFTGGAVEMSENWVAFEERQAAALLTHEGLLLDRVYDKKMEQAKSDNDSLPIPSAKWGLRNALRELDSGKLAALDFLLGDSLPEDISNIEAQELGPSEQPTRSSPPMSPSRPSSDREEPPFDPSRLTVAERKRWRNRMYMRRKRAEVTGSVADETTERLKPGRIQRFSAKERTQRGAVMFEKNKASLEKAGITSEGLQSLGLGMFRLTTFGKVTELLSAIRGEPQLAASICSELLSLLSALLKAFLVELIRRCILFGTQERSRTIHSKVFRKRLDKIRPDQIRHVARTMGGKADHSQFLRRLEESLKKLMAKPDSSEENRESPTYGTDSDLSTPSSEDSDDELSETESSLSESKAASGRRGAALLWIPYHLEQTMVGPTIDHNTPGDTLSVEEQELLDEMEEEEALDKAELIAAKKEEKELWKRVREAKRVELSEVGPVSKRSLSGPEPSASNVDEKEEVMGVDDSEEEVRLFKSARVVRDSDEERAERWIQDTMKARPRKRQRVEE